ncbi:MAG: cation-transporting P-type ATPase [Actinomycetota bacterium]
MNLETFSLPDSASAEIPELNKDRVFDLLQTSDKGLSAAEAERRLEVFGPNELAELKKKPIILKFLGNFYHFFAILLWVGGALAFVADMPQLGWAVFAVILINAVFSFWQEYKAEKATEALKKLMPRRAKVVRDGEIVEVDAADLVPGDILTLQEGDNISADARLIDEFDLRTNNATLTGESEPVKKTSAPVVDEKLTPTEKPNLVFAGTSVAYGSGRAVVFATGMQTEFGKIARMTQAVKDKPSPLQKEMGQVTKLVGALAVSLGILFFVLGYFMAGMTAASGFLFAVGIIVANVPEGLLPTVTLGLAMGVQRMAKRGALIKKLSSVETLGCTTVICTDKTGTLTQNEMTVREIWVNDQHIHVSGVGYEPTGEYVRQNNLLTKDELEAVSLLMQSASFCNNARLIPPSDETSGWTVLGDPTEGALLVAAQKAGFDYQQELTAAKRLYELPFDSVRKRMTTIHIHKGSKIGYVKGAPKEVLGLCTQIAKPDGVQLLDEETRQTIISQNDSFAKDGLRVLAMAYRPVATETKDYVAEDIEKDLVFVGLMAMMDPPREEVANAVAQCATAGIKIIMVTGDYGLTAESIARRIGIVKGKSVRIITGAELDTMSIEELEKEINKPDILFARVSPEHKMKIAKALKDMNHVVAMTGDGVNDAPALKMADIGVAMGISGTDVAKEAAEMVLTDDNFASIVNAVEEGRAVYDNIRRFVTYIFTSNIPEIVPFILFVLFKIPLPLTVMQILAIDLGTDLVPALALGVEKPEPDVMQRKPRDMRERLLNWPLLRRAYFFLGPIQAAAAMAAFYYMYYMNGWRPGLAMAATGLVYIKATTMTLATVVTTQIGNGFAQRTKTDSIFKIGFFSNKLLLWGILSEIAVIFTLVYIEPLQQVFQLAPLSATDWVFLFALAPTLLIADEIRKFFLRRKLEGQERSLVSESR